MTRDEIENILSEITYQDWHFFLSREPDNLYFQVRFVSADSTNEHRCFQQNGRKWLLSSHMTKSEIVQTALKAVLTAVEHEAREAFRYRGHAIFAPHFDVDLLLDLAACGSIAQDAREVNA